MKLTIEEISKIINGKIIGDSEITICRIANIENSKKGDICFISNSKYEKFLYTSKASCVIVNDSLKIDKELNISIITVNDSYLALSQLSNYIKNSAKTKNTHSINSVIGTTSNISKNTHIGHFSIIGENCIIEENVKILSVKTLNIQKTNLIEKGISTITIEYLFLFAIKKYFKDIDFDLVIYSTPPITFSKVIKYIKNKTGAFSYLLLKDIFPQNAIDMKFFKKNGLLHKYFQKKEKEVFSSCF